LRGLDTLVTPDTLLRGYRKLIALKWTYSRRMKQTIVDLVVRMALENPSWEYT
jgi:hypothetical protein